MTETQTPADVAARLIAYATEYNTAVWPNLALPKIDDDALLTMELRSESYSAAHNMGEHEANGICSYNSSTECGERAAAAEFVECNDAEPTEEPAMTEAPAPAPEELIDTRGSKILREAYALAVDGGLHVEVEALTDQTLRLYIEDRDNGGNWINIIQQTPAAGHGRPRHYAAAATRAGATPRDVLVSLIVRTVADWTERKAFRAAEQARKAELRAVRIPTSAELPQPADDCAVVTADDGSKTCAVTHGEPVKMAGVLGTVCDHTNTPRVTAADLTPTPLPVTESRRPITPAERDEYPTWRQIAEDRWESEEQIDGTPDFIATREDDGWRLKWRSSAQATRGFANMDEVRADVAASLATSTRQPGQHFLTYPTNSTAVCGSDMVGRRNTARDGDPFLTTCPRCVEWIEQNPDYFE